ncbi:MAG: ABC transporter ATP-binding protein, partial [Clostridia bacterium]|nr:ABC transporter ATP-binding protein [Clostridia bacterium]
SANLAESWDAMLKICLIMLGFTAGVLICAILANYLTSYIITHLLARVRSKLFNKVNSFSSKEINKFSIPSLITRSTNDLTQLQQVLTTLITLGVNAPLTAIFSILKIVDLSTQEGAGSLSIINIVSVAVICLAVFGIMFAVVPKFKKIQQTTDSLNKVTRENLTGLKVVRANNAEQVQEEKFEKVNTRFAKIDWFISKILSMIEPTLTLIMQGTSLAIVWVIGMLAHQNPALIALMTGFTQFSLYIITAFTSLSMLFMFVPRGIISGKRINEILETDFSIIDGQIESDKPLTQKGTIQFKNVSFRYPDADADVIENISFDVKQGQTVAFIGSTGSGKSTLINLIPRFYDCTSGEILINGINVKDYKQEALHELIGFVPQKGLLFSGTVESNIKYGKENASEEEVKRAIEISQSNFVYKFPEGIKHPIAQGGKNVSGGQKQRLSIARAVIKDPEILIFDDSFSALDFKTDKAVRRNLNKNFKDTTKLIVAQRIGTIMNADKIIVLNEGKMVGMGTHKQLLNSCEVYKEIALSQLSKEELA